jgi:hypothetical protein
MRPARKRPARIETLSDSLQHLGHPAEIGRPGISST